MFIAINKQTEFSAIIKDKTALAEYVGSSVSTISRKEQFKKWETKTHIIYNPSIVRLKSKRGGKRVGGFGK